MLRNWKPHIRWFHSRWGSLNFILSSYNTTLVSTQAVTKMRTRNLPVVKGRPAVCKADSFTAMYEPIA
jgi:hypothetical protein